MPNINFTFWGNICSNLIAVKKYRTKLSENMITYFGNVWFIVWLEHWLS
jgi:hypothetical protein